MDNNSGFKMVPTILLDKHVSFPGVSEKMLVGEDFNIRSVNYAIDKGGEVVIIPRTGGYEGEFEIEAIGVIANIEQVIKHQGGRRMMVALKCRRRVKIEEMKRVGAVVLAKVTEINEIPVESYQEHDALIHGMEDNLIALTERNRIDEISKETWSEIRAAKSVGEMADIIAAKVIMSVSSKREILAALDHTTRAFIVITALRSMALITDLQKNIDKKVNENIEKNQREYYLREQLKVIWDELGEGDSNQKDSDKFRETINSLKLEEKTREHLLGECDKLAKLPANSNEAAVVRTYIEECLALPWNKRSVLKTDIAETERILERDHYGMKKVKERILEVVAVMQLAPESRGQIVCLAGPPGVGKTSVAKSIAEALGRKYVRVSLGGVRDEADIRGHRKTYIGAMPGRIIRAIKDAGTNNPLVLLDEVDKLSSDYRGDPSAALLEVLDPEQNNSFTDHYIEVPFDLSDVMFITTANDHTNIPAPLLDRMDVIHMESYTSEEKQIIAKRHLVPKQMKKNGLNGNKFRLTDEALSDVITDYTREAGVRNLERNIASLMRKSAKKLAGGEAKRVVVKPEDLKEYLGTPKFKKNGNINSEVAGLVNGLAWTSVGGEMLEIEAALLPGDGKVTLTGSLGDVMKESAQTALSVVRRYAEKLGYDKDFYKKYDIHIHAPEGAVPKDGPSAGITMATAIISALTGRPVRRDIAMTGEITLLGRVLAIGGLREKSMAAYKGGCNKIIIPHDNLPDVDELSDAVKNAVRFVPAVTFDDVIRAVFGEFKPVVICEEEEKNIIVKDGACDESSESRI